MTEIHTAIRALGIVAALFSIYRGMAADIPLDDLIAILSIALAMIWFGNDLKKRRAEKEHTSKNQEEEKIDLARILGIGNPAPT